MGSRAGERVLWCWGCGEAPPDTSVAYDEASGYNRHNGPTLPSAMRLPSDHCGAKIETITIPEGLDQCQQCGAEWCWLDPGEKVCMKCRVLADPASPRTQQPTDAYAMIYHAEWDGYLTLVGPFRSRAQGEDWLKDLPVLETLRGKYSDFQCWGWVYGYEASGTGHFPESLHFHSPWDFFGHMLGSWFSGSWLDSSSPDRKSHMETEREEMVLVKRLVRDWLAMGIPKWVPEDDRKRNPRKSDECYESEDEE